MFDRLEYGEAEDDPEDNNLRGHLVCHFDIAVVVTTGFYDFKGNFLQSEREFVKYY